MPGPEEWSSRSSNAADRIRLTGPAALISFVSAAYFLEFQSCDAGVTERPDKANALSITCQHALASDVASRLASLMPPEMSANALVYACCARNGSQFSGARQAAFMNRPSV